MKWVEMDSTSIAAIGYDRGKHKLGIEFRQSGSVYFYFEVPPEEHEAFMAADSKGEYLNRVFKARGHRYSGPHARRRHAA
jgi:hypothetical protein